MAGTGGGRENTLPSCPTGPEAQSVSPLTGQHSIPGVALGPGQMCLLVARPRRRTVLRNGFNQIRRQMRWYKNFSSGRGGGKQSGSGCAERMRVEDGSWGEAVHGCPASCLVLCMAGGTCSSLGTLCTFFDKQKSGAHLFHPRIALRWVGKHKSLCDLLRVMRPRSPGGICRLFMTLPCGQTLWAPRFPQE